jgi:hypothetical protein
MIYYSYAQRDFTKNIMGLITNGYDLISEQFEMDEHIAQERIEKWIDRYHLMETPQQTYRRRLNCEPVFSLVINFKHTYFLDQNIDKLWEEFAKGESVYSTKTQMYLFCRTSDAFLFNAKTQKVLNKSDKQELLQINRKIATICPSAESFQPIAAIAPIVFDNYELVRLTKPKKSIKELQAHHWTHEKHATDWTWRLTDQAYDKQLEQGKRIVSRFQNLIEKQASIDEKKAYFERHFRALEGYLGYRGVRQQIGKLYHLERKLFQDKYNQPWFDHGARTLKLSYMKKLKNTIPNNASYNEAQKEYHEIMLKNLSKGYEVWKKNKEA